MAKYIIILQLLLALPLAGAFSPRYTPRAFKLYTSSAEEQLVVSLGAGKRLPLSLLSAGIIASGATGLDQIRRLEQIFENTLHRIQYLTKTVQDHEVLARKVLFHFHDLLFRRYHSSRTTLINVLDTGEFNCVSSAMLYNIAISRLGIPSRAVIIPGHVYSQVRIKNRWIDVETTHRSGFNPIRQKDLPDKSENREFIPEKGDAQKRLFLNNRYFTALLFYNRGTIRFHDNDPVAPIKSFVKALKILPKHHESEINLLAVFARWVGEAVKTGDTDTAVVRLTEARAALGKRPLFARLMVQAFEEGARVAIEKKDFKKGIQRLLRLRRIAPDQGNTILKRIQGYYAQWAQYLLQQNRHKDMLYVINSATARWPSPFLKNFKVHLISRAAIAYVRKASPVGGILFFNKNIPFFQESRTAKINRQFLYTEWGKHELKLKKYNRAYTAWKNALILYPGHAPFVQWKDETIKKWVAKLIRKKKPSGWVLRAWELFRKTSDIQFLQEIHKPFLKSIQALKAKQQYKTAFTILEKLRIQVSRIPGLLEVDRELISLFDAWGKYLIKKQQYKEGIHVWKMGLIRYPGQTDFSAALSRCYYLQAKKLLDNGSFSAGRACIKVALIHFPTHKGLLQLAAYFAGK